MIGYILFGMTIGFGIMALVFTAICSKRQFKADATSDRKAADIPKIIESVREWIEKHGVQSKTNNPEQFMHMAPHTWIFLEQILKEKL